MNQTALALNSVGLDVFPCYGVDESVPKNMRKTPAVRKGENWKDVAKLNPTTLHWPSPIVGVPIPEGVVVLDLDTYKGITREYLEAATGGAIPWDAAHIQNTASGGQHYAFRAPSWPCKNTSNAKNNLTGEKLKGLDLRSTGKGYIATGAPFYTPTHLGGPVILAYPDALPPLPEHLRPWVEHIEHESAERVELTSDDAEALREALRHIDPGCKREEWVNVGMALKNGFGDDPEGLALFDEWSSGELWPNGAPHNYVAEHIDHQYGSFKAEGGRTIATLYYQAIEGGWRPPANLIDVAAAFGGAADEPAIDMDVFSALVDSIQEHGGNPKQVQGLADAIANTPMTKLQRSMLTATLSREIKDSNLLSKDVKDALSLKAPSLGLMGTYGKSDAINAEVFLARQFPSQNACMFDEETYLFERGAWHRKGRPEKWLTNTMARDMAAVDRKDMKMSIASSSAKMAAAMLPERRLGHAPDHLVYFQDKVLDTSNWTLAEPSMDYGNLYALDFDYDRNADCPQWVAFVNDIFDGDQESIDLLQEWMGYNIVGSMRFQKVMLLLGQSRSGKGTIGKVLAHILGQNNFAGGSLTALTKDTTMNALKDKLGYFVGDAEKSIPRNIQPLVVEAIKAISGGDSRTFDRKYLEAQTITIPARITIAANHLPQLFDDSGALTGRLLLLCFRKSYLGHEDLDLDRKLIAESVGIVNWAMAGLKRLNENGHFTTPAVSQEEMDHISSQFSPLQDFIGDCCTVDPSVEGVTSLELYQAYQAWSIRQGDDQRMTRRSFAEAFKRAAPQFKHTKRRFSGGAPLWGFCDLKLSEQAVAQATGFEPKLEAVK